MTGKSTPSAAPAAGTQHVFISYSRKDSAFVDQLEAELNRHGIATWRDKHNIPGGMAWYQSIVTGLDSAYAMICVVSPSADESRWVLREQLYGDERGIPRVPVLFAPHRIPVHLIETQPIHCGPASFSVGIGQLAAFLRALQSSAPAQPTNSDEAWDTGRLREEYLRFLLSETVADLRDALYVNLTASTEAARPEPKIKSALASGLDMEMLFDLRQLGLEEIHGEAFDGRGDDVDDARQAVQKHQRVVLLGEPGGGKTTTLLKLVVDYARTAQADATAAIPVFVPLREFTGQQSFAAFVREKLGILQDVSSRFKLFYLLDALNEMPRKAEDGRDLMAEVRDFLRDQPDWVVSCRVRDYQDDLSVLKQLGKVRIKPLDLPQIREFITRFYQNTPGLTDPQQGMKLWQAMYGSDDLLQAWQTLHDGGKAEAFWGIPYPDELGYKWEGQGGAWNTMQRDTRRLLRLCRNPYMLTMSCRLFGVAGQLPPNRGALFQQFVTVLLKREEASAAQIGAVWLESALIRQGLAQIAYAMGTQTEMPRTEAEGILRHALPDTDPDLLLRLSVSASLMDIGSSVRFTHQLLQEYFASEVLGALVDAGTDPTTLWKPENWWLPNGREETVIILAGVRGDPEGIARWLAPAQPELAVQVLTSAGVALALNALDASTRQALIESAKAKSTESDPRGRAAAYRVLGHPDIDADDRPGVGVIVLPSPSGEGQAVRVPDIDWVHIPAGEFTYQDGIETLDYDFYIARYPVTYRQFQAFLDDPEGYQDTERWFKGLAADDDDRQMLDQEFKYSNHPRETVNWYQAIVFCRWLSWRMGGASDLKNITEWAVRLPTEYEWEKAARASTGWEYPYGNDFDAFKGNTSKTGIRQTSAVGLFATGDTLHWEKPVSDLSGNVWEWCLTDYNNPQLSVRDENISSYTRRVLRGGSWDYGQINARAAFRFNFNPDLRGYYFGFRVVCVRPPSQ